MQVPEVRHEHVDVGALRMFYRHSVPSEGAAAPTLVLLHGFPSASHQFRRLIDALGDTHRVIAPDYPGFGFSDAPRPASLGGHFPYTFDRLAQVIEDFLTLVGAHRFFCYVFDFGAPIGFRVFTRHPEWVQGVIAQNGNVYEDGLGPQMQLQAKYWADRAGMEETLRSVLTLEGTRGQYYTGAGARTAIPPESPLLDQHFLDQPDRAQIMLDLLYDYQSNTPHYPQWQSWLRTHQPPLLLPWGANDDFFTADGAWAYLADVPDAELHLLDAGHFALDEHLPTVARLIDDFTGRHS